MTRFSYGLLMPAGSANAEDHNAPLLGDLTLGIEVTEPQLAARCRLGNIDPQHGPSRSAAVAAIEAAADWPLPPLGSTLVTIRPDLDALGAMALLAYRAQGRIPTPPMKARIAAVGRMDRFDHGAWPGRRPLPQSPEHLAPEVGGDDIAVVAAAVRDGALSIDDRVGLAKAWVSAGTVPAAHIRGPQERAARLFRALETGGLILDEERAPGRLVEVVSEAEGALRLGYRLAPVVVALNPRFQFADGTVGPKFTIAQYRCGHADLDKALAAIARSEDGWGGSSTIKGSPQGRPSRLDRAMVAAVVAESLQDGQHDRQSESRTT